MARNFSDDDDNLDDDDFDSQSGFDQPKRKKGRSIIEKVKGKVMAPAICLILVGCLGLALSIFSVFVALTSGPVPVNPNDPPFVQEFQKGAVGPLAAGIQTLFIIVNSLIIVGAIMMLRFQMRGFAIAASVLAIINVGSCCCILGLPVGIWSLIILLGADVTRAFEVAASE